MKRLVTVTATFDWTKGVATPVLLLRTLLKIALRCYGAKCLRCDIDEGQGK
jgi:hypothetical protein